MRESLALINGELVKAKNSYVRENPGTLEPLEKVSLVSKDEIDWACQSAHRAFDVWSKTPGNIRGNILFKIAETIRDRSTYLGSINSEETGKPIKESTLVEIAGVARTFEYYAGLASKIHGSSQTLNNDLISLTIKEPVGVVAQILPWNFPMLLASWKIAPALASGCTMVIKPSELTPHGTLELAKICEECGLPSGVINVCPGKGEEAGDALIKNDLISKISFTGSTAVGKLIVKNSTQNLPRLSLELGGKAPNIVFDDANIESCLEANLRGGFFNQGENCTAVTRLLVHKKIYKTFKKKFTERILTIVQGDPSKEETEIGALISKDHFDRVLKYVEAGVNEGGKVLLGGEPNKKLQGHYFLPTLIEISSRDNILFKEEVFGPVVAIIPFEEESEAISLANDTSYGLAGGIWTQDISRAIRVAKEIDSGYLWINTYGGIIPETPYGGFKQSGVGKELGLEGLDEYLRIKNISIFTGDSLPQWYGKK